MMKVIARKKNLECFLVTIVLISLALIFIQSELITSHVHKSHDNEGDYCNLFARTIQSTQENFQKFDTVLDFQPIEKDNVTFYKNLICFNRSINLKQQKAPLNLLLETFLI